MAAAAAALAPASSSRLRAHPASRLLLIYAKSKSPRNSVHLPKSAVEREKPCPRPSFLRHFSFTLPPRTSFSSWNHFCSGTSSAVSSAEPSTTDAADSSAAEAGEKVRQFRKRVSIVDVKGGPDEGLDRLGQRLSIRGWVRTCRVQSSVTFIEVNDGSCLSNMQCVMNSDAKGYDQVEGGFITTGASVQVEGIVVKSQGSKQKVELKVVDLVTVRSPTFDTLAIFVEPPSNLMLVTYVDVGDTFLLGTSSSDWSTTNDWNLGIAAMDMSTVLFTVHTSSDGSLRCFSFLVGVGIGKCDPSAFPIQKKRASREFLRTIAHLRARTNTFGAVARVRNALAYATHRFFQENGFFWVSSPIITASDCEGAGEQFCVTTLIPTSQESTVSPLSSIPVTEDGAIDWSQDFFGKPAFLTVSGQLNGETYASALSDVYTFGPTFRAENSNTSRHLAEFWMIEPELAFADLNDDMACATAYLQYVVRYILENCKEDMEFFNTWIEKGIIDRLRNVADKDFVQLTYTDAIELLLKSKKNFEFPEIKAFYMRQNDDGKTVAAMDLLVPRVGELIGGSQREERLEFLENRLDELKLNKESYWWYLDLRRFGSVPHAGFGLGFERLVQFATGMENIRDAIPFPRAPGSAEF
ncbi:hypothetical protein ACLOJK_038103 [Asimina triloba]